MVNSVYADQVDYISQHLRSHTTLSLPLPSISSDSMVVDIPHPRLVGRYHLWYG